FTTYYADADGDTYGDASSTTSTCTGSAPSGYVSDNTDCNDANAAVNPGATEVCNGIDDDCDGNTDEDLITATITPLGSTTFCQGTSVVLSANTGVGYSYIWRRNGNNIPGATSATYAATKNGSYTVFITIPGGCFDESNPVVCTRLAGPTAIVNNLSGYTDLCFSPTIILKASGGPGTTYLWLKNGISTGVTTVTIGVTTPGLYQVVATKTSTGCQKTSTAVNIIETCRDGEVVAEKATLSVYPNPTASEFVVDMTIPGVADRSADIMVFNMLGEQVLLTNGTVSNNKLTETLTFENNVTSGVYFVRVLVNGENYSSQVVLTR
ncbi:MAG: MopE-related protein, partial [Chitinophagales bacterium]